MKIRIVLLTIIALIAASAFAQSDSQKAFDKLKTMAGTWEGTAPDGKPAQVTYRIVSGGSALLSEVSPDEAMITMFHLDNDRLLMTHYCGAGNQPRMKGTFSPDGKSVTFEFLDATNLASPNAGHMHRAVFTLVDATHHFEDWTYLSDGREETHRFELRRVATATGPSSAKPMDHTH